MSSIYRNSFPIELTVYAQAIILGLFLGELWALTQVIAFEFNEYIHAYHRQEATIVVCVFSLIISLTYFFIRGGARDTKRLIESYRFDLLSLVLLGLFISVFVGGVGGKQYQEYVGKINVLQLMILVAVPVVIALIFLLKKIIVREKIYCKKDPNISILLNDQAIKSKEDDLLNVNDNAIRFAEIVFNGGSSDSLVFGIDAPWGIGKSSFINICSKYWNEIPNSKIIVHRFEPLRYKEGTDIADKFIDDLINTIQLNSFSPEIRPLFLKYSRLIKGENVFSLFGIKFSFNPSSDTVEGTLERLEEFLLKMDWRVIVVVDDLDRLSWSAIKNILFAIKRSFMLPKVSYVLCYDTSNIVSVDKNADDAEKVNEFLEKFVTVKFSLYLDSCALANYVTKNFSRAIDDNLLKDLKTMEEVKEIINALQNIFNSNDFFLYQDFLGDIRKIKRLINTILLFKIEKTDFLNSDYNKIDIIHLLLLYVNYPHIFRKIYNTESDGKNGFFSLIWKGNNAGKEFENSLNFTEYIKNVTKNEVFLLNKLFDANQNLGSVSKISEEVRRSRACFNGNGGTNRNLERYLNLIVKLSKQNRVESYQFYVNMRRQFLQEEGVKLDDIFKNKEFDFEKGELSHDKFWTVIVSSSSEFNSNQGTHVLSYLMDHLPDYSLLEGENIGAKTRRRLIYSLVKLLNEAPWGNNQATSYNDSRTSAIANWIFGEDDHVGAGVLNTLAKPERGILGFYDLMCFRLFCCADRAGSTFNLQKELFVHGGSTAPLSGSLIEYAKEEMREISQKIFQMFKSQYITQLKNIFVEIDNLTQDAFVGMNIKFLQNKVTSGEIEQSFLDQIIAKEKTSIKLFVIYQLGNSIIESGVGCGVYDEAGNKDQNGIAKEINKYLFDFCFNPVGNDKNLEIFLDYLLMNFRSKYPVHENDIPGAVNEFSKVLDEDKLKSYWIQNKEKIISLNLDKKEKFVFTYNYTANYQNDLLAVYRTLDDLICIESP